MLLTLDDFYAAHRRIESRVMRTPLLTSDTLNTRSGVQLYFKCENFQKTGSFKARGAMNATLCLSDADAQRGVVTHSSGNHAAALSYAARLRGVPAFIVMPENAPKAKISAVRSYGGQITFCESTLEARETTSAEIIRKTGASFIHPYDNARVVAGQGTIALEILEDIPSIDAIVCPVGGGGHIGGVATAAKAVKPSIRIFGAEPAAADDAARSMSAGAIVPSIAPKTIADGLLTSLSDLTFDLIQRGVEKIATVTEDQIAFSMHEIWTIMKLVIEPSAAVPYAAAVKSLDLRGLRVCVVLSGGNLDLERLPWQA